jgi:hypothetical protein
MLENSRIGFARFPFTGDRWNGHATWTERILTARQYLIDAKLTAAIHSLDRARLVDFSQLLSSRVFRRKVNHGAPSHAT